MSSALFAYGTLEIPDLLRALTGRPHVSVPVLLQDHRRAMLRDRVYPAIVPARAAAVRGRLYLAIEATDWLLLDAFEGEEYERQSITVIDSGGRAIAADTYVLRPRWRHLLTSERWELRRFRTQHYARFLATCTGLRRDHATLGRLRSR